MAPLNKQQVKELFAKARQAQQKGNLDDAERGYKRLLKGAPQLAEVHFNLAEVYVLRGKAADAAARFEGALKLRPNEPAIWVSYLNMASTHPNPKNFDVLMQRAKPVLGKTPAFAYFEGLAALRAELWERAAASFKAAIDGGFRQLRIFADYGTALVELKEFDRALEQFDKGLALAPNNEMILFRKASLFQSMGRIDDARAAIERAIKVAPNSGNNYSLYASLTKMQADDPYISKMKSALKSKRPGHPDVPMVAYSLAKAMEDSGQFGKVFTYLNQANQAVSKAYPYDPKAVQKNAEAIRENYKKMKGLDGPTSDAAPIFVTGAPRSGTTLVEQILASHSLVEGGGELGLVQQKLTDLMIAGEDGQLLQNCAQTCDDFHAELTRRFPNAPIVTDKSISTFSLIGVVAKVMPRARVVVVRRDPRDNALSIYKNQFRNGLHRYANKLEHIAAFLRQFEELVEFWRDQCPDAFYEIRYEDLIADPENQSRALVAAAGLEWEEGCLSFYDTKREVKTLSATQVRQPMYSSSVGAWKKFEADMQPFLKAYGPIDD